jgi:hypothetical protein
LSERGLYFPWVFNQQVSADFVSGAEGKPGRYARQQAFVLPHHVCHDG